MASNNRPAPRNWNDIQVTIATVSMVLTLVFWNLFAGPDRASALKRAQEQAARDQAERDRIAQEQAAQTAQQQTAPSVLGQPTATPSTGPILLGGNAPKTQIIIQGGSGGGNDNGGGGGAGGGGGGGGGGTGGS